MENLNSIPGFIELFNKVHPELATQSAQAPSVVNGVSPGQINWLPILIIGGGIALAAIIYVAYENRRHKEQER